MHPEQWHINDHAVMSLKQKCPSCVILTRVLGKDNDWMLNLDNSDCA